MANIHHSNFKDTERVVVSVGSGAQDDGKYGVVKLAIRPNHKQQFECKLTIAGGDPHFNGTYQVSGDNIILPYQSASSAELMTFTVEPGQNIRRFSGVALVDDEDA